MKPLYITKINYNRLYKVFLTIAFIHSITCSSTAQSSFANDASVTKIIVPSCGPTLNTIITNLGTNDIISGIKIGWSVNGSIQMFNSYSDTITRQGGNVNIALTPNFNFTDGNNYTLKVYTYLPNGIADGDKTNDTLSITFKYLGPTGTPSTLNTKKCGIGRAALNCTTPFKTDSILWYDNASGGSIVARGKNTLSPPLSYGTDTFYAEAFKISPQKKLGNGISGTTYDSTKGFNGGMFNISPKNDVVMDSFTLSLVKFSVDQAFNIYMKTGTYLGFENNSSAWILIANGVKAKLVNVGGKNLASVKIPETILSKGAVYGFYVTTTSANTNYNYATSLTGGTTISDAEISVFSDRIVFGASPFNKVLTNYCMDLEVYYRKLLCQSKRTPLKIDINPSPYGAAFIKSTPFQSPQANTLGTVSNPDLAVKDGTLTYEIIPPSGYNNAGHGSNWITRTPLIKTMKGASIPQSGIWLYIPPSGSEPGKLIFTPSAAIEGCLIISMVIKDLLAYSCDTTIFRYLCVVTQPVADFKIVEPACINDNVVFTNSSVISGNVSYKWIFGTGKSGDTSNTANGIFAFDTPGNYNVTLVVSALGKGSDTITKTVTIYNKPQSGFSFTINERLVNFHVTDSGNINYQWDFGNGATSLSKKPQHYFDAPGKYSVCLSVLNAAGCLSKTCKEVSVTAGIDNLKKITGVKIYPNPNKGNFNITIENPKSDIEIAVYNLLGDLIKVIETNPLKSVYFVDLNMANGIYMVKVTNGGLLSTNKITINK